MGSGSGNLHPKITGAKPALLKKKKTDKKTHTDNPQTSCYHETNYESKEKVMKLQDHRPSRLHYYWFFSLFVKD